MRSSLLARIIIIIIIIIPCEWFTRTLKCNFSLKFEVASGLFKSPGLFKLLWLILTLLWSGWSRLFHWSPIRQVSFPGLWEPFQGHKQQLVLPLLSGFAFFFISLARCRYLLIFSLSTFTEWSAGTVTSTRWQVIFILIYNRSCVPAGIWWSVCMSEFKGIQWVSFSRTDSVSLVKFLSFVLFPFLTQMYLDVLVLYPFFANLLYSLIVIVAYPRKHELSQL